MRSHAVVTARGDLGSSEHRMPAPGRREPWDGDPTLLGAIMGRRLSSASALAYGENRNTAKVEPDRALKSTPMWHEIQQMCPNVSFKKKDLLAGGSPLFVNRLRVGL